MLSCLMTSQYFSSTTLSMVSVPVLSVHSMSMAPKFWIEFRRFTMTFFFAICVAPIERFMVYDERQHLRGQPDRDGKREHEGVYQAFCILLFIYEPVYAEYDDDHDYHDPYHDPSELVHALVETGLHLHCGQPL